MLMMKNQNEVIEYFENVLGIFHFKEMKAAAPAKSGAENFVLHFIRREDHTPEELSKIQELFEKMLEALNWNDENTIVVESGNGDHSGEAGGEILALLEQHSPMRAIVFTEDPARHAPQYPEMTVVFSPKMLLKNPDLKRDVWNQIKFLKM